MSQVYRLVLCWLSVQIVSAVVIQTKYGSVNGTIGRSRSGLDFLEFYGIPFAEPPIGHLRFKAPVELKSWTGIKDTQKKPPACVQSHQFGSNLTTLIGQEDCLYLNIFTPVLQVSPEKPKLPVMVYIHGGAFMGGHTSFYGPEFFMDKQIVLVTIQYRLGPFGFLGMGVDDFSGNFGLKDQTMALRWVSKNIGAFGGNAHNVTLFGHSAGSASVHLQMFVPHNKGLFHRAILQSGTAFNTWAINSRRNGRLATTAFAVAVSCYRRKVKSMLTCLQELPALELVNAENRLMAWHDEPLPFFKPMVEGEDVISAALPQAPHEYNYEVKNIPWIIGMTTGEGAFKVAGYLSNNGKLAKELNENYLRYLPIITHIAYISDPEKLAEIAERIKVFYFGTQDIGAQTDTQFVNMVTDFLFTYPLIKSVQSHHNKTYVYFYDHNNQVKKYKSGFGNYEKDLGVTHGQELYELFSSNDTQGKLLPDDFRISQQLINYWTNFATYGNPNGKESESNEVWTPTKSSEVDYLWMKTGGCTMAKGLLQERYNFWDSLPLGLDWLAMPETKDLSKKSKRQSKEYESKESLF